MNTEWDGFFSTISQVAVTAFSIMFLAMQVRSSVWRGKRLLSVAAVAALVELFVPLLASLVTLMADHSWRVGSLLAGGLGLAMVLAHWIAYKGASGEERAVPFNKKQLWGSLLSLVIYGLVVSAAFDPWGVGIYMLSSLCVWLILSGSFEAWWLLEPEGLPAGRDG